MGLEFLRHYSWGFNLTESGSLELFCVIHSVPVKYAHRDTLFRRYQWMCPLTASRILRSLRRFVAGATKILGLSNKMLAKSA